MKAGAVITLLVLVVAGFYFYPSIIGALSPEVPYCDDEPKNYKCVCHKGYVKTGMFPWSCDSLPDIPDEVTLPIETWEEAIAYTEEVLGDFKCTGDYQYDNPLEGSINKQCNKYGSQLTSKVGDDEAVYGGQIIIIECRNIEEVHSDGRPSGGHMVYSVRVDPNDGHLYELTCNSNLISCPETTFTNNWKEPDQITITCGDGCCHFGETYENCPDDCEGPPTESQDCCGDGFCEKHRVQTTSCLLDGQYRPIWTHDCIGKVDIRPLSECDGYDEVIEGIRQVSSRASMSYLPEHNDPDDEGYGIYCPADCA